MASVRNKTESTSSRLEPVEADPNVVRIGKKFRSVCDADGLASAESGDANNQSTPCFGYDSHLSMFSVDVGEVNRSDCGSTSGLHMPTSVCLSDTHSRVAVALPFTHALLPSISVSVHIAASPLPRSAGGQMINIIESETQTRLSQTAPRLAR